jgi:Fe-coproporphyrin III synthase
MKQINYLKLGYYAAKAYFSGTNLPIGISIDVTSKCNLRCKHCYFFPQNHKEELNAEDLLAKIREIKRKYPSIIHASWVGGEPLLRKEIVEEGIKIFPLNMVVTNGSMELPGWKNCVFNVSVDGTKNYYEKIRGIKIYDAVKEHANRNDIRVNIACVLNKINLECIKPMLEEWRKTKVIGVSFGFYTPIKGEDENLSLGWEDRDKIINKLLVLKQKYGNFLLNSKSVLKLMKSENAREVLSNCLLPKAVVCLDPMGNRKMPCVIGDKADCKRCGCIIPFQMESVIIRKQIESFWVTKNGVTQY